MMCFPEKTFHWVESLRTLKFWWMIMSIVKEAVKLSPWFWLLSLELQALIVWMVMRPGRQQMLACLYNPNPTNKFLPQKLGGTSWHPGDGDTPSHSHMPPARPIVQKKKKKTITITKLFAVFCNDFMAWFNHILEEWKEKEHLILFTKTFVPKTVNDLYGMTDVLYMRHILLINHYSFSSPWAVYSTSDL